MIARLAFAISTVVAADILLIDEGIGAVDEDFMEKAETRLLRLAEKSQIVVVASHEEQLVRKICTRGVVMDHGRIEYDGELDEALKVYARLKSKSTARAMTK